MRVQRIMARDAIERDGETALVVDEVVVRLGLLSTYLYALCEQPVDVSMLAESLEAEFGTPEGRSAIEATQDAVAEMIRHGVLFVQRE